VGCAKGIIRRAIIKTIAADQSVGLRETGRDCGRHAQKDYWDDFLHGRFPPRTWKIMVGDFHFFKWFAFFLKFFIK
jgi:hypothetical protein